MKIKSGVLGIIAVLVLLVGFAFAAEQQSDPGMQQSGQSSSQDPMKGAAMNDPQTIKQVQQALSSQGYDPGPIDGTMNSKTQSALMQYQQAKGMPANGQLDRNTLASLGISGSAAGGPQDKSSQPSGGSMPSQQNSNPQGGSRGKYEH